MKKYIAMAAVAMMFAACTNDDMPETPAVDKLTDKPITVNAGVVDLTARAGMTTDNLTELGLFIINDANDNYTYKNIKFEKTGGTTFTPAAGHPTPLWQNSTQEVMAIAYAPWNEDWDNHFSKQDFSINTDQTSEVNVKNSDLLYAMERKVVSSDQTGDIIRNNGALDINLRHALSKLTVNVRFGDEIPAGSAIEKGGVVVTGLYTVCLVNLRADKFEPYNVQSNIKDIKAYKNEDSSFEAIVVPQTSGFSVEITVADNGVNRTFIYNNSSFEFQTGMAYTLNLIVGKDKVEIADEGISVGEWKSSGTSDDLITE